MSEIRANTVSDAAGTGPATLTGQYAAKAWVNFDGTGTIAARDSGNVSSLTDNGTGLYAVNLSNAFSNTGHSPTTAVNAGSGSGNQGPYISTLETTKINLVVLSSAGAFADAAIVITSSHGDLA